MKYYPNRIKEEEIPKPRMGYREFLRLEKEAEEKWKWGFWKSLRGVANNLNSMLEAGANKR